MTDTTLASKIILEHGEEYIETKLEYARLKATEKVADFTSSASFLFVACLIGLGCIFMASVALALKLSKMLGSGAEGFFIVGGFYGFLLILMHLFRAKWITTPVYNAMLKKILN